MKSTMVPWIMCSLILFGGFTLGWLSWLAGRCDKRGGVLVVGVFGPVCVEEKR